VRKLLRSTAAATLTAAVAAALTTIPFDTTASAAVTPPAIAVAAATSGSQPAADAAPSGWTPRPATYGVTVQRDVPITMSDGVVLRADVYRPAAADGSPAAGRFPVILTQTPYNKTATGSVFAAGGSYFVQRGYVFVQADVRGTGSSEGQWDSFGTREQKDGLELANWATSRSRPWSNGTLGLWGASYMAINQFFTAAQHPRGLKAIFPIVPAGDVYRDVVASGGEVDAGFIPLWLGLVTATGVIPPTSTSIAPDAALLTLLQHLGGALGFQVPEITGAFAGGDAAYDGPFYTSRSPLSVVDKVDVPTFIVGGEYDIFQRGEPMLFQRLQARGVPSRLLIGPWTHLQAATDPDLSGSGLVSLNALALRWFDHYLRGVKDPALGSDIKPVTYDELGSSTWRTASSWLGPQVHARALPLGDGSATALHPVHGDVVPPIPVAGLCSRSTEQWTAGLAQVPGCQDDDRLNDQLGASYETDPLSAPLHLLGPMNAQLSVSTTGTDGLLAVSIEDVAPDGSVKRLTGGWQTLRHRALNPSKSLVRNGLILQPWHPYTRAAEETVTPGKVMKVDTEIFPTGAVIAAGHRLRVTVTSYDAPHLLPTLPQLARGAAGVITIHHTKAYPSSLVIPVRT